MRRAWIALFAVVLVETASAQELDPSPIFAPTSYEQCQALSRDWEARLQNLYAQEKVCSRRAYDQLSKCPAGTRGYGPCASRISRGSSGEAWSNTCLTGAGGHLYYACDGILQATCAAQQKREAQMKWCNSSVEQHRKKQEEERQRQAEIERQRREAQKRAEEYTNRETDRISEFGNSTRDAIERQTGAVTKNADARTASLQKERDYFLGVQDQSKRDTEASYSKMSDFLDKSAELRDRQVPFSNADRDLLQSLGARVAESSGATSWAGISLPTQSPEVSVLTDLLRAPANHFADYGMNRAAEWTAEKLGAGVVYGAAKEVQDSIIAPALHFKSQVDSVRDWTSFVTRAAGGEASSDEVLDRTVSIVKSTPTAAFGSGMHGAFSKGMVSIGADVVHAYARNGIRNLETAFATFPSVGSNGSSYRGSYDWSSTSYGTVRSVYLPPLRKRILVPEEEEEEEKEPLQELTDYEAFMLLFPPRR